MPRSKSTATPKVYGKSSPILLLTINGTRSLTRLLAFQQKAPKSTFILKRPAARQKVLTKDYQGRRRPELRWSGKSSLPGFLNAEHIFTIEESAPERVRFIQREEFDGLLTRLFGKGVDTDVRQGFQDMNDALKKRAERSSH